VSCDEAAAGHIRIHLLGRFEVRTGQRLVIDHDWNRHKASALLKRLALTPGRRLHREQVMDALWPNMQPSAAANNLYKSLHYLRTAFAAAALAPPVHIRAGTIALSPQVWVDVEAFRNAARDARNSRDGPKLYEQALEIYTGDLLPDDIYDDETNLMREELKTLQLRLLVELSELCERGDDCQKALGLLERVVQADPVREEAHRAIMRLHARNGGRTEAIRQYQACRAILQRELGIAPSEETEALYRQILEGRVEQPPSAVTGPAPAPPPEPRIRHTTSADGVKIAYWTLGQGPPLVMMSLGPHSHVQIEWQMPPWRAFYEMLAQGRMLVRYDGRGTGLSDWNAKVSSLEEVVSDLESVVDHLSLREFSLFSPFHCGPAAVAYAARYPERVNHLILWCSYARGADFASLSPVDAMREVLQRDWELYCNANAFYHMGQYGVDLTRQFAQFMRSSASQAAVLSFVDAIGSFDVTALLPRVRCPTLVLHRREIPWLDPDFARRFAAGIPNARLVFFEGDASMPFVDNTAEVVRVIDGFLGE